MLYCNLDNASQSGLNKSFYHSNVVSSSNKLSRVWLYTNSILKPKNVPIDLKGTIVKAAKN